ncbi:MAG TPA: hypothetical protein VE978_03560 [Chitinophagales bacterium]|nr:hypothetical protein [Chitinophagales bacterium]
MSDLNVQHYLGIYRTRLKMQEEGITNPTQEFKEITRTIVDKLSKLPLDEKIILDDHKMKDSRGNVIAEFPFKKQ